MNRKFLETIEHYGLLFPGESAVAALSGGVDSVVLLHLLLRNADKLGLDAVTAVHVNHHLRGEESDRDEAFCRRLCESLGVPLTVFHADVQGYAREHKRGIEESARELRYQFLRQAAGEHGKIVTAHHLDDNLETVFLNLLRGTGLKGACGIPYQRDHIVRPFMECTRGEIEAYAQKHGLSYVTDSSNGDLSFRRNRIRQELFPLLKQINPAFEQNMLRFVRSARADEKYLALQAAQVLEQARCGDKIGSRYSVSFLRQLPDALRMRALKLLAGHSAQAAQLFEADSLLQNPGKVQISGSLILISDQSTIWVGQPEQIDLTPYVVPFQEGEVSLWKGKKAKISVDSEEKVKKIHKKSLNMDIDYDKIIGSIILRNRRPGDVFHPMGRGVGKSLKKLFNEAKIDLQTRADLVILQDDLGILWVEGFGPDQRCCTDESTRRRITVEIF